MKPCQCQTYQNTHTLIYKPGQAESVAQCQECGNYWYVMLHERMGLGGDDDLLETYQIPLTQTEYEQVIATPFAALSLDFLRGRAARVIHEGGKVDIDSDLALSRCGR